jgi:hypothetical protein
VPIAVVNTGSFNLGGPSIRGAPQYYNSGSSGVGSTFTVAKDPAVQPSDTILVFITWNGTGTNPTISGFTAYPKTVNVFGIALFSRVADGTEGSTFTVNFASGFNVAAVCVAYQKSNGVLDPVPSGSGVINLATTLIQGPGVTATVPNDQMIWFGAVRANGAGAPTPVIIGPSGLLAQGAQSPTSNPGSANMAVLLADGLAQAPGAITDQDGTASLAVDTGGILLTLQSASAAPVSVTAGLAVATGVAQLTSVGGGINAHAGLAAATGAAKDIQSGLGTLFGAYMDETQYTGGLTHAQAITRWQTNSGRTLAAERLFEGTSLPSSIPANVAACVTAGRMAVLDTKPFYAAAANPPLASGSSQATLDTSFNTFLAGLVTGGLTSTNSIISIWHEPYFGGITGASGHATFADFIAMFRHYAPLVHSHGLVTAFITSAASVFSDNENACYPGDSYVDVVMTDYYIPQYTAGHLLGGGTSTDPAQPADNATPPKPFGFGEAGSSNAAISGTGGTASPTYSLATAQAYWTYLETYFNGRLHANQPCAPILYFNTNSGTPTQNLDSAVAVADGVTDPYNTAITEWRNGYIQNIIDNTTAVV